MKRLGRAAIWGAKRVAALAVAYALVLHLLVGALAGSQLSAQAASQGWSFFEICYGSSGTPDQRGADLPARHGSKQFSCIACAGGAVAEPPAMAMDAIVPVRIAVAVRWIGIEDAELSRRPEAIERQRGPPPA